MQVFSDMYTEMYYFFWVWNLLNVVSLVKGWSGVSHLPNRLSYVFFFLVNKIFQVEIALDHIFVVSFTIF